MIDCKKTRRNLVAFLYGECHGIDKKKLEDHLEICRDCRKELMEMKKVHGAAESLTPEMEKAMDSVDWDNLSAHIVGDIFDGQAARERRPRGSVLWSYLFQPRFRLAYAGLFLGVIVGVVVTFLFFRTPSLQDSAGGRIMAPQGFYDMMELEIARRETIDYLDRSEFLLLDFVQSTPEQSAEFWRSEYATQKARDLLSKKKYIDPQLDRIRLAKAKFICDQIELLFFELMQISDELSQEDLEKIQRLIQERQILLKIKLVRKELQKSEV